MEFHIAHTRIRIHPLLLMMIPLASRLGLQTEAVCLIIALCAHEGAHMAMAACMRVPIPELTLMPFGGSACIGNPYVLSSAQLGFTAAAGPVSNGLLILICAALCHWDILSAESGVVFIRVNALLMLFNLLPALPLDGGRILYALLYGRLGRDRALSIGIWTGRLLAIILLACAVHMLIFQRVFNLSYAFAAVFIIASGPKERQALNGVGMHTLISALSPLARPLPVNLWAVDAACAARTALKASRPGCVNLYAVYENGALTGFTDDRSLLGLCIGFPSEKGVCHVRDATKIKAPPEASK